ncbi:digalactosyldiacylglycerol synthase 2, chloroplastic-like isoform X2 [Phragmites australis]|uniref:digalactosyldiacylglycerol synthase 2, chloroplastic-like isoform X2 n=1 Tax=Phragmites australis TaxID=29695 RepID=UPI002D792528|nr:digalactosyldiacylglycerol synthase 2, chloroplastic-like isoform X2 [Phragmites australis]
MSARRHFAIFTTASLPWMTGTAINPLFRAAYLSKDGDKDVTLVIPWLPLWDQELVYPNMVAFDSPLEHEGYIRCWIEERIDFRPSFSIKFYPGKFSKEMRSILPVGDITECIPDEAADIAVLEEPEHLNWYHHGRRWKSKFWGVIGIVHTNYLAYVKREKNGQVIACILKYANTWVTRIYCHKIIRLSGATQNLPRSVVCNVHGVNPKFLEVGKLKMRQMQSGEVAFTKGAYYIGKMVWGKGYRELFDLLSKYQSKLAGLEVDLYGTGEDSDEVRKSAKHLSLTVNVHPGCDHADPLFHDYKVFINPSTTDVVCTTTAEALAMGKIVICANHPSNEFFKQFPNCRIYNNDEEFVQLTLNALSEQPAPLTDMQRYDLSWEAATERFIKAADMNLHVPESRIHKTSRVSLPAFLRTRKLKQNLEDASVYLHQALSGLEVTRCAFGAVPKTLQPDEQLCKDLGLAPPKKKKKLKFKLMT